MKRTYENFEELAREMTSGDGILHVYNCALNVDKDTYSDTCLAWQKGIMDFAEWLDHIGIKIEIPDDSENFYDFMAKKYKTKT